MRYLICYDITKPKRLVAMAKCLENYGIRFQKSFFSCDLEQFELEILREKLLSVMDMKTDKLTVYPVCEKCYQKMWSLGTPIEIEIPEFLIL